TRRELILGSGVVSRPCPIDVGIDFGADIGRRSAVHADSLSLAGNGPGLIRAQHIALPGRINPQVVKGVLCRSDRLRSLRVGGMPAERRHRLSRSAESPAGLLSTVLGLVRNQLRRHSGLGWIV